jgi:hypothetical protein
VTDDITTLHRINIEIGAAESRADSQYFEDLLSPHFVMGRPDGTVNTKHEFIEGLHRGSSRSTEIREVTIFPANRALAACLVRKTVVDDASSYDCLFHNIRVFARTNQDSDWSLIAWLNEPAQA